MEVLHGFSDRLPYLAPPPPLSLVEFGAAMTVLIASRLSIPISTTHCVVGSVFAVGLADGIKAVNWRLFINIVLSWVITLPITLGLAAATFALLDLFY
jgi:phosphate/sulfate permease